MEAQGKEENRREKRKRELRKERKREERRRKRSGQKETPTEREAERGRRTVRLVGEASCKKTLEDKGV